MNIDIKIRRRATQVVALFPGSLVSLSGHALDNAAATGSGAWSADNSGWLLGGALVLAVMGYYTSIFFRTVIEYRRLAAFPRRSPNIVMRLSTDGRVLYANPATRKLLARIGADPNVPQALFPDDLSTRLAKLRDSRKRNDVWMYEAVGRALRCHMQYLPDLAVFHAYVWDITERRQTEESLVHQTYHDALTGLPNRRMYQEFAPGVLATLRDRGDQAALFLIGLDRFENVIDSHGHEIGDQLLQAIATRFAEILSDARDLCPSASIYRFEGDVYAIFTPGLAGPQWPILAAERITRGMGPPLHAGGREFYVSFSMGISVYPGDGNDAITLLQNADTALQRVKKQGGHGFELYKPEMNAMAASFLALESYLRHALARDELCLHYQPQIDIKSGRTTSIETLLRWNHPERGLLAPGEFIKLAEETGLIVPIGEWALRTACAQSRRWRDQGLLHTTIAVNISARQFHQQNLPSLVNAILTETGLAACGLELEITEGVAMHDVEHTAETLKELRRMGVRLAIDDFGTGFSSLSYLKRFPIDKLKIDRSFVRNLTSDENDAAITRAIVTLGHELKLKVVAEGVESEAQLLHLKQCGCDEAQGNLVSEALPPERLAERLTKERRQVAR